MKGFMQSLFELDDHNRRVPSMEGLRGVAILLVFVCHYNDIVGERLMLPPAFATLSHTIGIAGGSGVDLFFLLSGFLIYRTTLRPALHIGAFWMRRVERIYPTFLVVFACFIALGAVHLGPSRLPGDMLHRAATIAANLVFLPGMFDMPAIISAAWSLSYEWFFYLALPIVVSALALHRWSRGARVALLVGICIGYEALCVLAPALFPVFANYEGTHVRMLMFVSGMIVYELLESKRFQALLSVRTDVICITVSVVCAGGLLAIIAFNTQPATLDGTWSPHSAAIQVIPTFVGFACLALVTLRPDGLLAEALSTTWLRWTGNISYSFYLVHSIPMHAVSLIMMKAGAHAGIAVLYVIAFPVTLALTWGISAVLFAAVEKPLSLRPRRNAVPRQELQPA